MSRDPALIVVVVAAAAASATSTACAPEPLGPGTCAAYAECFFVDDAAALRSLAAAEDPELGCYDSFADADDVIAAMVDAYSPGGLCFRGGLSGEGANARAAEVCIEHCTRELQADCRRAREGQLAVCAGACGAVEIEDDDSVDDLPVCPVTQ